MGIRLVARRREDYTRLGFAIQLGTARFLGTFHRIRRTSRQGLSCIWRHGCCITDPACLPRYLERPRTHYEHAQAIKRHYGYHDFHAHPEYFRLVRWLYPRAWLSRAAQRAGRFRHGPLGRTEGLTAGCHGVARLVARIRDRAASQLWLRLAQLPNAEQQAKLEALVDVSDGARSSQLDQLRRPCAG